MERTALMAEIRRLEAALNEDAPAAEVETTPVDEEKTARRNLLAEIDDLETTIDNMTSADEDDAAELPEEDPLTASLVEPGVEDEITQDYLTEVESIRHGEEDTTEPSMHDVAGYTARLKEASVRLDRVAEYLEKQGNKKFAYSVDKIADMIDRQLTQIEGA